MEVQIGALAITSVGILFGLWQWAERKSDTNRDTKCGLLHAQVSEQITHEIRESLKEIHSKLNRISESSAAIQVRVRAIEESKIHNGGFDKLTAMVESLLQRDRERMNK